MSQEGAAVETETLGEAADVGKAEPRPRRALFTGAAAAGLSVAASLMFGERTARAANGGAVKLGDSNTATATTSITTTVGSGLQATTSSDDGAVVGVDTSVDGSGIGVWGQSSYGDGVVGQTNSSMPGMSGVAAVDAGNGGGYGVYGVSRAGYGVYGVSSGANPAIYGQANGVGGTGIDRAGVGQT